MIRAGEGTIFAGFLCDTNTEEKMAEAGSVLSRHDLEAKIVKRCWEDEAFRKEFTADPAGAFTRYLEVPKDRLPKIVVHEEEPGSWHIVLPPRPANAAELSEVDLERVAGGVSENADEWPPDLNDAFKSLPERSAKLSLVSKVVSGVSAVIASGVGSLIVGQNVDTGW
jgi:hypothetical protein